MPISRQAAVVFCKVNREVLTVEGVEDCCTRRALLLKLERTTMANARKEDCQVYACTYFGVHVNFHATSTGNEVRVA